MIKKVTNFLDKHRFILVILILTFFCIITMGIKILLFFNHSFKNYPCTKKIDDVYCYYQDYQIYVKPEREKEQIFKTKKEEINALIKSYKLPPFNYYTSYYYEIASLIHYNETGLDEELYIFFKNYNMSYKISTFYRENVLLFDIFYHYKVI